MSKHTPGPWEIDRYSDGLLQIVGDLRVVDEDEESVTTVVEAISYGHEANAHLIAAAPDLLICAEQMMAWWEKAQYLTTGERDEYNVFDGDPDFIASARTAISKAKGETK